MYVIRCNKHKGRSNRKSPLRSGDEAKLASAKAKNRLQLRRSVARNAGSTYAPDFLGMLKIELIKKWALYHDAGGARSMPLEDL